MSPCPSADVSLILSGLMLKLENIAPEVRNVGSCSSETLGQMLVADQECLRRAYRGSTLQRRNSLKRRPHELFCQES